MVIKRKIYKGVCYTPFEVIKMTEREFHAQKFVLKHTGLLWNGADHKAEEERQERIASDSIDQAIDSFSHGLFRSVLTVIPSRVLNRIEPDLKKRTMYILDRGHNDHGHNAGNFYIGGQLFGYACQVLTLYGAVKYIKNLFS